MILKASQRGGGRQLALHLMRVDENEHVHVHELRGFTADDLEGAFKEAHAISRGTRAKQFLFSLSLNPPPNERVSVEAFESAIGDVEQKLGLNGQPRAVVFHEKDGRRHAHVVWSRIDAENMKAINLPFFKTKLRDVARELFLEHGWQMPRGFVNSRERDPASFSLAEWQQAKRGGHDPKALKQMFQELWASSDSGRAFAAALQSRGYLLAQGDRRSHVAVDYRGEVYAIARYTGIKAKVVRARLGDDATFPSVDEVRARHAERMTEMLRGHVRNAEERRSREAANLLQFRKQVVDRQRAERLRLENGHGARQVREAQERARRFARGLRGLWHRVTGRHAKTREQNEREACEAFLRDRAERDKLIHRQLDERRALHQQIKQKRREHAEQVAELHRDIATFREHKVDQSRVLRESVQAKEVRRELLPRSSRRSPDRGPSHEL